MSELDSENQSLEQQMKIAAELPPERLLANVINYNWDMYPGQVLGLIADRPDCTLLTALQIFYHSEPSCYENPNAGQYEFTKEQTTRLHDRINAGGYRHQPEDHEAGYDFDKTAYVAPRQSDRDAGREILWELDPDIVLPACEAPAGATTLAPLTDYEESQASDLAGQFGAGGAAERMAQMAFVMQSERVQRRALELLDEAKAGGPLLRLKNFIRRE